MRNNQQLSEIIDQEIDFIGQLFVEYEQMTSYQDILTSQDNLRSLASLYFDFVDRIVQVLKSRDMFQNPGKSPEKRFLNLRLANIVSPPTIALMQPFLQFYENYSNVYPDKINREEIVALYHQLPEATENVARDLRNEAQKLRTTNAR